MKKMKNVEFHGVNIINFGNGGIFFLFLSGIVLLEFDFVVKMASLVSLIFK